MLFRSMPRIEVSQETIDKILTWWEMMGSDHDPYDRQRLAEVIAGQLYSDVTISSIAEEHGRPIGIDIGVFKRADAFQYDEELNERTRDKLSGAE